jgi:hypothetical protein
MSSKRPFFSVDDEGVGLDLELLGPAPDAQNSTKGRRLFLINWCGQGVSSTKGVGWTMTAGETVREAVTERVVQWSILEV